VTVSGVQGRPKSSTRWKARSSRFRTGCGRGLDIGPEPLAGVSPPWENGPLGASITLLHRSSSAGKTSTRYSSHWPIMATLRDRRGRKASPAIRLDAASAWGRYRSCRRALSPASLGCEVVAVAGTLHGPVGLARASSRRGEERVCLPGRKHQLGGWGTHAAPRPGTEADILTRVLCCSRCSGRLPRPESKRALQLAFDPTNYPLGEVFSPRRDSDNGEASRPR
jgi:hypothetical protein